MLLGVPVLKRYDLLERLIASAEAGIPPKGYLIVDNGNEFSGRLEGSVAIQHALRRGAEICLLEPRENIGVAAAWNAILDEAGDRLVVISNDDIELGYTTIVELVDAYNAQPGGLFIADGGPDANGWCLFLHSPELFKKIGPYDESFHPAYYEDSDYRWRMKLEGLEPVLVKTDFKHSVRGSWSDDSKKHIRRSLEQFERKWGGDPRGDEGLLFRMPFDGAPVAYSLRKRGYRGAWRKLERRIYRWDVINAVATAITSNDRDNDVNGTKGANYYLEIGVGSGETMRQVKIRHKTGVDPNPTSEGSVAADISMRLSSDTFFAMNTEHYDVAFVDGLHHTDQAYRDVENACKIARAVVVHDASPTSEAMQRVPAVQGEWTGDVWKAIARLRREGRHTVRTVDADYGIAVVIPNKTETPVILPADTYADLERHRQQLLGLITFDEFENWLKGVSP